MAAISPKIRPSSKTTGPSDPYGYVVTLPDKKTIIENEHSYYYPPGY